MSETYVITGGPCCGKTSVIRELAVRGYHTVPDNARHFVNKKASEGYEKEEVWDRFRVGTECIKIDRVAEQNIPENVTSFLDYSLACNIAYHRVYDGHDENLVEDIYEIGQNRYDGVFIFDRLPYEQDDVRGEDDETAELIHRTIHDVYEELGYDPVSVPVVPIEERADIIEEHIHE